MNRRPPSTLWSRLALCAAILAANICAPMSSDSGRGVALPLGRAAGAARVHAAAPLRVAVGFRAVVGVPCLRSLRLDLAPPRFAAAAAVLPPPPPSPRQLAAAAASPRVRPPAPLRC